MVDPDGVEGGTVTKLVNVVPEATTPLILEYDEPGKLFAKFVARFESPTAEQKEAGAKAITLFNTKMTETRAFKTVTELPTYGGTAPNLSPLPQPWFPKIEATSLFPFHDGYTVYAGACEDNNPDPEGKTPSAAVSQVEVLPHGEPTVTLELPVLRLTVYRGSTTSSEKASGAEVVIHDTNCPSAGLPALKGTTGTTGAALGVLNIALPFSQDDTSSSTVNGYTVCAFGKAANNNNRRSKEEAKVNVPKNVTDIPGGQSLNLFLEGSGTSGSSKCAP